MRLFSRILLPLQSRQRLQRMAATNMPTRLERFERAMESMYGPFNAIDDPSRWTPPPKSGGHRGRYLWTDAFGVVNFLTLYKSYSESSLSTRGDQEVVGLSTKTTSSTTESDKFLILANRLVHTVHEVLGRTRDGKSRLPGATDSNPLGGGLRIGKIDESGPDGDGQYHHYLTLWMFALNRLSLATGDPSYNNQAIALAKAIHPRFFVNRQSTRPRMVWKMAMDLSTALVPSEGGLDPIDGYVVFRLLQATASEFDSANQNVLDEEIADYKRVMERRGQHTVSSDPLDLGMSLWTGHWFAQREPWAAKLVSDCFEQIYELFELDAYLSRSIRYRLAFREFGTCLGINCHEQSYAEGESKSRQQERASSSSTTAPADETKPSTCLPASTSTSSPQPQLPRSSKTTTQAKNKANKEEEQVGNRFSPPVPPRHFADEIIKQWEPYVEKSLTSTAGKDEDTLTPDDLRPITKVMYAAALIPGAFRKGYLGPEPKTKP